MKALNHMEYFASLIMKWLFIQGKIKSCLKKPGWGGNVISILFDFATNNINIRTLM